MGFFKWEAGRQHSCNYEKFCFLRFRIWRYGFDGYLLRFYKGTRLPWHKDEVPNGKHWRFTMTLKGLSVFYIVDKDNYEEWHVQLPFRTQFFRPDLYSHRVDTHEDTLKLSLGFVKFNK